MAVALPQSAALPDFKQDASGWGGLLAPVGIPYPIVNQISKEFGRILALPDIKKKLSSKTLRLCQSPS